MGLNFKELRQAMVDSQVRTTDVTDLRIVSALFEVPREAFVSDRLKPFAYIDDDLLITEADAPAPRYLMEASPFAKLVQLAEVAPDDLILDVGCGTGYSAAVLSKLGSAVIALEDNDDLYARASEILTEQGFDNVAVVSGPLAEGYPAEGPYDVIFLGGAVEKLPQALFDQLKAGGRLVAVEGYGLGAFASIYLKDEDGIISGRKAFNLSVKPLPGFEKAPEFSF